MKSIKLKYFAMLRDKTGLIEEQIETYAQTYHDLFLQLDSKYQFNISSKLIRIAENNQFVPIENQICDGATIAFIPPVAGG